MILSVVTPPPPVVTLDAAKQHLRVDSDDTGQDDVITRLVAAATATIDAPDGWLGRAIGAQTLQLEVGDFPGQREQWANGSCFACSDAAWDGARRRPAIHLPCPPIVSIASVAYLDEAGAPQTLDSSDYELVDRVLMPTLGTFWPATCRAPNAVTIRYQAGYETVPPAIVSAILLMTGSLYENREDVAAMPCGAAAALLQPYRLYL